MSSPVCTRCQKIYSQSTPPAKCVNCGGDVKVPGAKPAAVAPKPVVTHSAISTPPPPQSGRVRKCNKPKCTSSAVTSLKYFYEGKRIILTPLTPNPEEGILDFCQVHADTYEGKANWTIVKQTHMPGAIKNVPRPEPAPAPQSTDSGCGAVFAIIFALVVLGLILFGAIRILMEIFSWNWDFDSGDSNVRPFRLPFRRR